MKKFQLIALITVLLLAEAAVRVAAERAPTRSGLGYFIGGAGWVCESGDCAYVFSVGGGGLTMTNNWILGGEGHSVFGPDNAGGYGFLDVGYTLLRSQKLLFFPLLGLGGGSLTREGDPLVSACALVNPSLELDYLIHTSSHSGILLGLRAGCTLAVYSDTFYWSLPHARLLIGGFGFED